MAADSAVWFWGRLLLPRHAEHPSRPPRVRRRSRAHRSAETLVFSGGPRCHRTWPWQTRNPRARFGVGTRTSLSRGRGRLCIKPHRVNNLVWACCLSARLVGHPLFCFGSFSDPALIQQRFVHQITTLPPFRPFVRLPPGPIRDIVSATLMREKVAPFPPACRNSRDTDRCRGPSMHA